MVVLLSIKGYVMCAGLDIATVLVAFATKFSPFATENSSAVATLRPVFT